MDTAATCIYTYAHNLSLHDARPISATGIISAAVVLLGVLSLPVMLRQKYDKRLAAGIICASGTLGILIPPSIMLVLVGDILQISVGDLFIAAMFPGLVLGGLYIAYILGIAFLAPHKAPAVLAAVDATRPLSVAIGRDTRSVVQGKMVYGR